MSLTLQDIYGEDAAAQIRRYEQALEAFTITYGPGEVSVFRAPGRVNLIGEHTDYNHGFVLPVALDKDVLLLARPRFDGVIRLSNLEADFPPLSFTVSSSVSPGAAGDWGNYAKGVARELSRRLKRDLKGLDGLVAGQPPYGVPRAVGLSSSSAVTVAVALALASFNGFDPDGVTMAQLCAEAEWYVGTRGGIMDHFIALLGQGGHALFLDCRPDGGHYRTEQIPLPPGYSILIADSGVRHQKVKGAFNQRVAACRAGVKLLQDRFPGITHLRDVQDMDWDDLAPVLADKTTVAELARQGIALGDLPGVSGDTVLKVLARCRHVWTENQRVRAAVAALRAGEVSTLGRLLNEAHASARDDYEVSCPELECLVAAAREVEGVVGARLTGAGWGGCIVAVVQDGAVSDFEAHISQRYRAETGRPAPVFTCRTAPGAGSVLFDCMTQ